jgi:hypothetical protein
MPTPNRDRLRRDRDADPLAGAVSDAARSGVRAMGSVGNALRDTIGVRGRTAGPSVDPARHTTGAATLIDEIAGLLADFLDRAGGVAQDVATGIDERTANDPAAPPRKELELHTAPGGTGAGQVHDLEPRRRQARGRRLQEHVATRPVRRRDRRECRQLRPRPDRADPAAPGRGDRRLCGRPRGGRGGHLPRGSCAR